MNKKQIEEMANIIYSKINGANFDDVSDAVTALYDAGYRKQSKSVWRTTYFSSEGKSPRGRTIIYRTYTCDACDKSNGRRKTNYCPHCGAKMKGGA